MATIRSALRQLVLQQQSQLPPLAPPEVIVGTIGRIDWGTEGSGSSGGGGSGTTQPGRTLGAVVDEIKNSRTYWEPELIFDSAGKVSVTVHALKSCVVQDDAGNQLTVQFNNPYAE